MFDLKLPKKTQALLSEMASERGVSEEAIVLEALLERLEDWYDAKLIQSRAGEDGVTVPIEEIVRELGLHGSRDAAE